MKSQRLQDDYLIRLEKGEELVATLTGFCAEHDIKSGWVTGIGSVQRASVGYFNPKRKKYVYRRIKDAVELASLSGNVSEINGLPFLHLHAVVTNKNNQAHGGHVHHVIVGTTAEIRISVFDKPLVRQPDEESGLSLLEL